MTHFKKGFGAIVSIGDKIDTEFEGFNITAIIDYDIGANAPDYNCEGFWPSIDPKDAGYVGEENIDRIEELHNRARAVMDAWRNDEWFYATVTLSVSKNGVMLSKNAASMSGLECNYPKSAFSGDEPNAYLTKMADELVIDAIYDAKLQIRTLLGAETVQVLKDCAEKESALNGFIADIT